PDTPDEPDEPVDTATYVAFVTRYNDALNAPILHYWGLKLGDKNGEGTMGYYAPILSKEILDYEAEDEPYWEDYGSEYTAAEIKAMRTEKEKELKDLELDIKLARVNFERLTQEVNDGCVISKVEGVVKAVRDPDECMFSGEPVIEVSGGGGYIIEVTLSELELADMEIGQTVTINSWETGENCEGTVKDISLYPATNADSWSNGNTNVTYYPFTVFVDENANLRENSYVSVTYSPGGPADGDTIYLENMYIRNDGAKSYVYAMGANGLLEKRTVVTGKSLWGSYVLIKSGLTLEDKIAFPYGKDVKPGAKTNVVSVNELYNY
ncbi:MAG: hypothetical protein HUJ65_01715, partial [Oscillospiraceae bacterium]|nr:hypothetical protein [Oscillospiraceae bacterium]